jgi:Domain of unknown function (DUF4376)
MNLQQAQQMVNDRISAYCQLLISDFFTWNSNQWNSDPQSQSNIMGANILSILNGGNLPVGFQWRDYYNNMNTVTGTDMAEMFAAGAAFVSLSYNASWTHKSNIAAMTNPVTVLAYDYQSTLWPDPNTQY